MFSFFNIEDIPSVLDNTQGSNSSDNLFTELVKCVFGQSEYSFNMLYFLSLIESKRLMSKDKIARNTKHAEVIRSKLLVRVGCVSAVENPRIYHFIKQ